MQIFDSSSDIFSVDLTNTSDFLVDRSQLLSFLRGAQAVLDKKADKSGGRIIFQVKKKQLFLMIDGSLYIEAVLDCDSDLEINFSTSCTLLYDLIKTFDSSPEKIRFTVMENFVRINYMDGEFNIGRFESERQEVSLGVELASFSIKFSTIVDKFKLISMTIPEYDIRQYFRGAHVVLNAGYLTIWSSDGHRLSLNNFQVDGYDSFECIWPKKFIDYICLTDSIEMAQFTIYETHVKCSLKNKTLISPLVNASVIQVSEILPKNHKKSWSAIFEATDLIKRIDRVMVLNDGSGRILLEIANTSQKESDLDSTDTSSDSQFAYLYSSNSNDFAIASKSKEKVKILRLEGVLSKIYFNGISILSFLRNFKGLVEIKYFSDKGDIVITQDGHEYPLYLTKELL